MPATTIATIRNEQRVSVSRVIAPPFFTRFAVIATISDAAAMLNPNFQGQNMRSR